MIKRIKDDESTLGELIQEKYREWEVKRNLEKLRRLLKEDRERH